MADKFPHCLAHVVIVSHRPFRSTRMCDGLLQIDTLFQCSPCANTVVSGPFSSTNVCDGLPHIKKEKHIISTYRVGGSEGGRQGRAPPPPGPKFFHFHAVFGKKFEKIWPSGQVHYFLQKLTLAEVYLSAQKDGNIFNRLSKLLWI